MTTRTIDVAPKLADECCYMCSIPGGYGFPVELSLIEKGKRVYRLRPVKVERTKATREDFKAPTGFKEARDIFELQFCEKSKSYSDAMNDLFMTAPDEK